MRCEKCGNELSSEAFRCPNCGEPTAKYKEYAASPHKETLTNVLKIIGYIIAGVVAFSIIINIILPAIRSQQSSVSNPNVQNNTTIYYEPELTTQGYLPPATTKPATTKPATTTRPTTTKPATTKPQQTQKITYRTVLCNDVYFKIPNEWITVYDERYGKCFKIRITDVKFENTNTYNTVFVFYYDAECIQNDNNYSLELEYKVYDGDGYVITTDNHYLEKLSVGEKTRDQSFSLRLDHTNGTDLEKGSVYKLSINTEMS